MVSREAVADVLIVTASGDEHAFIARWALAKKGASVCFFFPGDTLLGETVSISASSQSGMRYRAGKTFQFEGVPAAAWLRRTPSQTAFPVGLDPKERKVVAAQANYLNHGFLAAMSARSFCVNPIGARYGANLKIEQLRVAADVGFQIPDTLISNDPEDVRNFVGSRRSVVCKGLGPALWLGNGRLRSHTTARVSEAAVRDPEPICSCPAIYQEEIEKSFEARVTVMGRTIFCAYIKSQDQREARLDWRVSKDIHALLREGSLPGIVKDRVLAFMRALGIVFGAFDFIVDRNGNWFFLEVNEAGQFLWVEDGLPQFTILDAFSEFVLSGSPDFEYTQKNPVRVSDYDPRMDSFAQEAGNRATPLSDAGVTGEL